MNTFRDEINKKFGVKLRKSKKDQVIVNPQLHSEYERPNYEVPYQPTPPSYIDYENSHHKTPYQKTSQHNIEYETPHYENPNQTTVKLHSQYDRPQSFYHEAPSHQTSHLYLDRCIYLPPVLPGADGNNIFSPQMDFNHRNLTGAGNWQFGNNKFQNFQPGTPGRQIFKPEGNFTLQNPKKTNGGGIRRAQSFASGPRPHSMYQTVPNNDIEIPSLQHQKAITMSASQTSLVSSGLSKIGGKINRVFSFKNNGDKYLDDNKKRQLTKVIKRDKIRNSCRREQSFHGVSDLRQNYSDLVSRNMFSSQTQNIEGHLQKRKLPQVEHLPDVVNHERTNTLTSAEERLSRKDIIKKSNNFENNNKFISEDQWFSKEKLYKDHITEVLEKWKHIEDNIWAKVIVLERNRRVAKAYARSPVLTINGSDDGFDGVRIGVNGFANFMRDHKVNQFKSQIGSGCKLKMGDRGDILIKRIGKGNIYIKNILEETAVSNDILKLPTGLLELDIAMKLFDMKKFKQNLNREIKRQFPDRQKLETQCISTIAFVKNEGEILDSPIWVMVINMVALEMLEVKIPIRIGSYSGNFANYPSSQYSTKYMSFPNPLPSSLGTYSDLSSLSSGPSNYHHGL